MLEGMYQNTADVILFPPEEDEGLTDEDSDAEDDLLDKDPNHLGKGLLSQQAELVIHSQNEELADVNVVSASGDLLPADDDQLHEDEQPRPSTRKSSRPSRKRAQPEDVQDEPDEADQPR